MKTWKSTIRISLFGDILLMLIMLKSDKDTGYNSSVLFYYDCETYF